MFVVRIGIVSPELWHVLIIVVGVAISGFSGFSTFYDHFPVHQVFRMFDAVLGAGDSVANLPFEDQADAAADKVGVPAHFQRGSIQQDVVSGVKVVLFYGVERQRGSAGDSSLWVDAEIQSAVQQVPVHHPVGGYDAE